MEAADTLVFGAAHEAADVLARQFAANEARAAKITGACVLALLNVDDSAFAGLADGVSRLPAGPEHRVAATRSYLTARAAVAFACETNHMSSTQYAP